MILTVFDSAGNPLGTRARGIPGDTQVPLPVLGVLNAAHMSSCSHMTAPLRTLRSPSEGCGVSTVFSQVPKGARDPSLAILISGDARGDGPSSRECVLRTVAAAMALFGGDLSARSFRIPAVSAVIDDVLDGCLVGPTPSWVLSGTPEVALPPSKKFLVRVRAQLKKLSSSLGVSSACLLGPGGAVLATTDAWKGAVASEETAVFQSAARKGALVTGSSQQQQQQSAGQRVVLRSAGASVLRCMPLPASCFLLTLVPGDGDGDGGSSSGFDASAAEALFTASIEPSIHYPAGLDQLPRSVYRKLTSVEGLRSGVAPRVTACLVVHSDKSYGRHSFWDLATGAPSSSAPLPPSTPPPRPFTSRDMLCEFYESCFAILGKTASQVQALPKEGGTMTFVALTTDTTAEVATAIVAIAEECATDMDDDGEWWEALLQSFHAFFIKTTLNQ